MDQNIALKIKTMDLTEIYKFKTSLKRSSNCLTIISHSHITYDEEMFKFILAAYKNRCKKKSIRQDKSIENS